MKMVSLNLSHEIMGKVGTNVDWEAVPLEAGKQAVADPTRLGREATRFLQNGGRIEIVSTNGIIPPEGGMVRILTLRRVDEGRPWIEAILAGGPQTPADYDVRKVGDQYPPTGGIAALSEVVTVNFGAQGVSTATILAWAKQQHLRPARPRRCFATAEQYPDLNVLLGVGDMAVVSLEECAFGGSQRCCGVWWGGARREAYLGHLARVWSGPDWFLFVRE